MHADPCEAALDAPLMYEAGWGKRLSYVFAFGEHEVVDVARRYAASWPATLRRRGEVKEGWLELTIAALCEARQADFVLLARAELEAMRSRGVIFCAAPGTARGDRADRLAWLKHSAGGRVARLVICNPVGS